LNLKKKTHRDGRNKPYEACERENEMGPVPKRIEVTFTYRKWRMVVEPVKRRRKRDVPHSAKEGLDGGTSVQKRKSREGHRLPPQPEKTAIRLWESFMLMSGEAATSPEEKGESHRPSRHAKMGRRIPVKEKLLPRKSSFPAGGAGRFESKGDLYKIENVHEGPRSVGMLGRKLCGGQVDHLLERTDEI